MPPMEEKAKLVSDEKTDTAEAVIADVSALTLGKEVGKLVSAEETDTPAAAALKEPVNKL